MNLGRHPTPVTRAPLSPERRETIFDRFDTIRVSHAAVLINDDDPQVLLHQLQVERPDTFVVEYLESDPTRFVVRVTRVAP
jgi:uncharacterized protein (DUF2249 family)